MPISLTLGDFTFDGTFECPQTIPGGGKQALAMHDELGGVRVVDSLGSFEDDIGWNGTFIGITAEDRIKYVNGLRKAGNALVLSYSTFQFLVVIKSFTWNFKPNFFIDYNIVCTVIQDQSQPINVIVPSAFNDTLIIDLIEALTIAELIANPSVTSALALLDTAITNIPNFGGASNAQLAAILAASQAALNAITQIIGVARGAAAPSGVGATANNYVNSQSYASEIEALEKLWSDYANAYQLQSTVLRIQRNTEIALYPTGTPVQIINSNLFQLAVQQYGDAMQWTVIAEANKVIITNSDGFPDPFINGISTISVPPPPSLSSDGIMDYA